MRPSLHQKFVDKAEAAITAAVEVYNKPSFAYREETFAILALNAWELLLKAKIIKDAGNKVNAIRVYRPRPGADGKPTKKEYLVRNRAGNAQTIALGACIVKLDKTSDRLPPEVRCNLDALTEIRDNSIHFVTASALLAKQAQELSAAAVKNFVLLAKKWFSRDLSKVLHLVLPLSFVAPSDFIEAAVVSEDESRLIQYLQDVARIPDNDKSPFAVAVRLQLKLEKSNLAAASKVQISRDPSAVKVLLSEQDIRDRYPWDYGELCKRMEEKYSDFKKDKHFHALRKPLQNNETYAKVRYLDPGNPKSQKKYFYNPNVLKEFAIWYTER